MPAFSKLQKYQNELIIPYNCYEVGHTWTPFCSEACVEVGLVSLKESFKIYTPLYLATLAFHRKYSIDTFLKTIRSIITSSCFLSFNAFSFIASMCTLRKVAGKWSYLQCAFLPGLIANFLAIAIERPNRRSALALYTTNLASETLFRMAVNRKLLNPVPNGEVMIFCVVMASFLYIMRKKGFHPDFVSLGIRFLLGSDEAKLNAKKEIKSQISSDEGPSKRSNSATANPSLISRKIGEFLSYVAQIVAKCQSLEKVLPVGILQKIESVPRHPCCPHNQSCLLYVTKGFLKPFLLAYAASAAVGVISAGKKLLINYRLVFQRVFTNKKVVNFALFLGGFAGIFRAVNCGLRWVRGKDSEIHAIPAGLLAGSCMMLAPSVSVSLYLAWKLVELLCHIGMEHRKIPSIPGFSMVLYAVSTAVLFYTAVLEPHNLKPTYLNFLNRISANRLEEINRHVLDIFGVHSSKLYHEFWPELSVEHTSRSFQETVLVWMIH